MNVIFWNGGIQGDIVRRYVGPYKVAHWIRKHGYTCQVIDFVTKLDKEWLYKLTKKFITDNTEVLAISTTFICNNKYAWANGTEHRFPEFFIDVLKVIKKEHPNIKIILGGYMAEKINGYNLVNATVMSYTQASEDIFLEYLDHVTKKTPAPIGNVVFPSLVKNKQVNYRMWYNTARNPTYSIEQDDFKFVPQDVILPGEPLPLDVSRGCIFACRFCQYPHLGKGKLDYIRGMEYLENEILENYKNFGTTSYYILDDTFNDTETKLKAFYDMTQRLPFKITFTAYLRADLLHRFTDMPHLLQESGLFGAYHGIESLDPEASKIVGKAWSGKHAREYIPELYHNIWKKQVTMKTNFIIGLPHDTEENIKNTLHWHISNDLHCIRFSSLGLWGPGDSNSRYTVQSEFDKNAEKYGFEFLESDQGAEFRNWKNNNWTQASAKELANQIDPVTKIYSKISPWATGSLLWYGRSQEYLMNTLVKDIEWQHVITQTQELYKDYFKRMFSLPT